MTALHHYKLECDAEGCTEIYDVSNHLARETRSSARKAGWAHAVLRTERQQGPSRSLDYCPAHAGAADGLYSPPLDAGEIGVHRSSAGGD